MSRAPGHPARLATALGRAATARPRLTLALAVGLAVAAVVYAALAIELEPERNALVRPGRAWNARFEAYRRDFEGTTDFVVVVQGGTLEARRALVDRLRVRLEADPRMGSVLGRIDPEAFAGHRLLLLSPEALERLRAQLEDHAPMLEALARRPSLATWFRQVNREVAEARAGYVVSGLFDEGPEEDRGELDLELIETLLEGMTESLRGAPPEGAPWRGWLDVTSKDGQGYISVRDDALLLVFVAPASEALEDGEMLDALRAHVEAAREGVPDARAGITGKRALNVAEMRATVRDTQWAAGVALLGIALLFILGFGRVRHPLFAVFALAVGVAWSAGALTLVIGHLTVLSVAFTSILFGLGVDFGVHVVARFEDAHRGGAGRVEAIERAVAETSPGNVAGALTTSLAFFGIGFSEFLGLAELGIIAGMGVLLCLIAQLTVLPAMLALAASDRPARPLRWGGWLRPLEPRRRWAIGAGVVLAGLGYAAAPALRFDGNLLALQAEDVEAVELEKQLIGAEGALYGVARASSLEDARALAARFEALPEVAEVDSAARLVPEDQAERARRARAMRRWVPEVEGRPSFDLRALTRELERLRARLRRPELRDLRAQVDGVLERLEGGGDVDALRAYARRVMDALVEALDRLRRETDPEPLRLDDLPLPLARRLISQDGDLLLRIRPVEDVWEDAARARFVAAIRRVDPDVTGIPVQTHEASRLMVQGYIEGGIIALVLVVLVLAIDLRRARDVGLALVPLAVGAGWALGVMALTGLELNLANLIILPLMIGIGIDIGVHLVHRARAEGSSGAALVAGPTGRAVVLSSFTTMVGFGALMIADHRGLASIGALLSLGVASNLGAALFVQSFALRALTRLSRP